MPETAQHWRQESRAALAAAVGLPTTIERTRAVLQWTTDYALRLLDALDLAERDALAVSAAAAAPAAARAAQEPVR